MTALRYLDDALLEQLEERLLDKPNSTLRERLRPGLTDEQIDSLTASLGIELPEEARRWYRWHNGSSNVPLILSRTMTSLETDVRQTLEFDEENWQSGWLNVMDERPYIVFDCRVAADAPVPVWHYDYSFPVPTRPVFASIGELVSFWIELIDNAHIVWDPERSLWQRSQNLPEDVEQKLGGVPSD